MVQVDSANDTLTGFCVLFEFQRRCLQVNRQRDMTNRTCGLKTGSINASEVKQVMSPDLSFNAGPDVLLDALTVEDMPAL